MVVFKIAGAIILLYTESLASRGFKGLKINKRRKQFPGYYCAIINILK